MVHRREDRRRLVRPPLLLLWPGPGGTESTVRRLLEEHQFCPFLELTDGRADPAEEQGEEELEINNDQDELIELVGNKAVKNK